MRRTNRRGEHVYRASSATSSVTSAITNTRTYIRIYADCCGTRRRNTGRRSDIVSLRPRGGDTPACDRRPAPPAVCREPSLSFCRRHHRLPAPPASLTTAHRDDRTTAGDWLRRLLLSPAAAADDDDADDKAAAAGAAAADGDVPCDRRQTPVLAAIERFGLALVRLSKIDDSSDLFSSDRRRCSVLKEVPASRGRQTPGQYTAEQHNRGSQNATSAQQRCGCCL